ncbi:MAG: SPOR domain-containing protein [Methyloligellaceae bacterium]
MQAKQTSGISIKLSSPIEVYRFGWMLLAGTSAIYLFFIVVRSGLGLSFELSPQELHNRTASMQRMQTGAVSRTNNRQQVYSASQKQAALTSRQSAQRTVALSNRSQEFQPSNQAVQRQHYQHTVPQTIPMHKANLLVSPEMRTQRQNAASQRNGIQNNRQPANNPRIRTVHIRQQPQKTPVVQGNFISNAGYAQGFVQDLQFHTDSKSQAQPRKNIRNIRQARALYGVRLAQARSVSDIRKHWARLNSKYFKMLRPLNPLIFKVNTGDQYPVKLIVGPFQSPESAIKFCARLKTTYDCNLKRYMGTPL